MNRQRNIDEARSLLADIELGEEGLEAKRWRVAELAAEAIADGMTQTAYAEAIGVVPRTVSRYIAIWNRWGRTVLSRPLFKDATAMVSTGEEITSSEWNRRNSERRVPTRHEDKVEMVTKLLADPEVAKATAAAVTDTANLSGRLIAQAVHDQDHEDRRKRAEWTRQEIEDKALPLPAYMAKMVVKINDFTIGLSALTDDDLDGLPDGRGRELVAKAARGLALQAQRIADRLERKPDLRLIEGKAIRDEVAS